MKKEECFLSPPHNPDFLSDLMEPANFLWFRPLPRPDTWPLLAPRIRKFRVHC
jgi:hypothetical protein